MDWSPHQGPVGDLKAKPPETQNQHVKSAYNHARSHFLYFMRVGRVSRNQSAIKTHKIYRPSLIAIWYFIGLWWGHGPTVLPQDATVLQDSVFLSLNFMHLAINTVLVFHRLLQ